LESDFCDRARPFDVATIVAPGLKLLRVMLGLEGWYWTNILGKIGMARFWRTSRVSKSRRLPSSACSDTILKPGEPELLRRDINQ